MEGSKIMCEKCETEIDVDHMYMCLAFRIHVNELLGNSCLVKIFRKISLSEFFVWQVSDWPACPYGRGHITTCCSRQVGADGNFFETGGKKKYPCTHGQDLILTPECTQLYFSCKAEQTDTMEVRCAVVAYCFRNGDI